MKHHWEIGLPSGYVIYLEDVRRVEYQDDGLMITHKKGRTVVHHSYEYYTMTDEAEEGETK